MSPHIPAILPLQARLKSTFSRLPGNRITAAEHNRIAHRVVDYLHSRILKDRRKHQTYRLEEVAAKLGIKPQQVRASLAHAGTELITVVVTAEARDSIRDATSRAIPIAKLNSQNDG
jgi:hypothetical protein